MYQLVCNSAVVVQFFLRPLWDMQQQAESCRYAGIATLGLGHTQKLESAPLRAYLGLPSEARGGVCVNNVTRALGRFPKSTPNAVDQVLAKF